MPRNASIKSESGICHIMLREINRENVFKDDEDNRKFPEIQSDCMAVSGYKLFVCCLAGSHRFCIEKDESGVIINENTADFVV